jgi:ketosteroid isomerase-like protein
MSRENLDLALLMYELFNRRDLDAMLALIDDEVEIESRLVAMEGSYNGQEGVRRWWGNLLDVLPDYTGEIEELHDLEDITLLKVRGRAHGAASNSPVVETFWQPIRWRGGMCMWWRNCATEAEALKAIELQDSSRDPTNRLRPG